MLTDRNQRCSVYITEAQITENSKVSLTLVSHTDREFLMSDKQICISPLMKYLQVNFVNKSCNKWVQEKRSEEEERSQFLFRGAELTEHDGTLSETHRHAPQKSLFMRKEFLFLPQTGDPVINDVLISLIDVSWSLCFVTFRNKIWTEATALHHHRIIHCVLTGNEAWCVTVIKCFCRDLRKTKRTHSLIKHNSSCPLRASMAKKKTKLLNERRWSLGM